MRFILTTLYDSRMREVGLLCNDSLSRFFGSKPDYQIVIFDHLLNECLAPSWNKLLAVKSVLTAGDWVLWLDADCVVHQNIDLVQFVDTQAHFRPAQDYNGINCGVFMMRNCDWSFRFIDTLLFLGDVIDEKAFGPFDGPKWEQNAIKALINSFSNIVAQTDPLPKEFVSDPVTGFRQDSFIYHAFAMSNTDRLHCLSQILAELKRTEFLSGSMDGDKARKDSLQIN